MTTQDQQLDRVSDKIAEAQADDSKRIDSAAVDVIQGYYVDEATAGELDRMRRAIVKVARSERGRAFKCAADCIARGSIKPDLGVTLSELHLLFRRLAYEESQA